LRPKRAWAASSSRARQCGMACQIPDGIRLVFLPPYTPELLPAETLWALVDESIINKHIATIKEREAKIAERCVAPTVPNVAY
jgi:transposase